jgi:hypothetical protein
LKKENEEDTRWKDLPYFGSSALILWKWLYSFKQSTDLFQSIKISVLFFTEIEKSNAKFTGNHKKPWADKTVPSKRVMLEISQNHSHNNKTTFLWHKKRHTDQ